jgi:hypothetical protein
MIISMYQASVPRFVNILGNLSNILDKAQTHVDAKKLDTATLTTYRLFPDMLPMTSQVQIACDTAKGVVARLAGMQIPVYEDNEKTLADLNARIAKTIAFIQTVTPEQIDGTEDKEIVATRSSTTKACNSCSAMHCRISIFMSPPPTTSCATTASRSGSATTWAILRQPHQRKAPR